MGAWWEREDGTHSVPVNSATAVAAPRPTPHPLFSSLPRPLSHIRVFLPGRFALPVPAFLRGGATPVASSSSARSPHQQQHRPSPTATLAAAALDNSADAEDGYDGQFEEAELDQDFSIKRITGDGRCMFRALVSRGREGAAAAALEPSRGSQPRRGGARTHTHARAHARTAAH